MDYKGKIFLKFKTSIILYLLLGIGASFLNSLNIYYFQKIIDSVKNNFSWNFIIIYAVSMILVTVFSYISEWPKSKLFNGLYYYFKEEALKKVSIIDYSRYLKIGTGSLLQKIESGSVAGRGIYFNFWFRIIRELLPDILFNLFFISLINIKLIPIILIGYVAVFATTKILLSFLYDVKKDILINEELLGGTLVRGITELVTFRINQRYSKEINSYQNHSKVVVNNIAKMTMTHELFFTIFALLVSLIKIITIVLFFTGNFTITIGGLVGLIAYIDKIYNPIAIFNVLFVQYKLDCVSFSRLENFFQERNDLSLVENKNLLSEKIDSIAMQNVDVKIGSDLVLRKISYKFEKGLYGIVGESGSGKSTLVKTLLGLLKNSHGNIYYNEKNLNELNLNSLYDKIFYLSQDVPVFDGTLKENIVFDKEVPDSTVIEVLSKCQLSDFYNSLEEGLETRLGEKGSRLSGGEKQRVAFARLFFSEANVIILDEATSAMDVLTETNLMNNIKDIISDKVTLIITHRIKNLNYVNEILCMESGQIKESGSFLELTRKKGILFKLIENEENRESTHGFNNNNSKP
ncbi:ABC transporter ATP-binding protein/permease [Enterococcus sp. ALS3]|uniref:ABC transporter ATP-binding protein/permease n=1 Tax=Enterococcus alishanensis TaxID=1303817 RepID=A0ABS6THV1_9ENTE|nr:ABC transporter ATP-binding protein [Enterococcus alishanensis]MBV7392473.1 ABC transporter ATP-binding protein/permease [Enterococcus alishanensis]